MITRCKSTLAALSLALCAAAPAHAGTVYTFNNGLSCPSLSSCGIGTNSNLSEPSQGYAALPGFDGQFARGTVINAFMDGLPAHTSVSIDFLLAVIDSWDGLGVTNVGPDIFEVLVDGNLVFAAGYSNFNAADQSAERGTQLAYGVALGFGIWNDAAYDMSSVAALHGIAHSSSSMTVQFRFANSQGIDDESFALENLRISVNDGTVPEPSMLALLGAGLAALGLRRRRA